MAEIKKALQMTGKNKSPNIFNVTQKTIFLTFFENLSISCELSDIEWKLNPEQFNKSA